MAAINKSLVRLVSAIHAELAAQHGRQRLIEMPSASWEACSMLATQVRRAELRGWHLAAVELSTDLRHALLSLESQLVAILRDLPTSVVTQNRVTVSDLYADLVALGEEFEETNFDREGCWVSVTTEPLELEGIYLGPFEIRLNWRRGQNTYRVIATDPHPPESRDNVTHPHVMDQVLCEGDGKQAIRNALLQGRLLDFFTLVAGVLRNYNPESPFVELSLWYGRSCSDCGTVVHDDDCCSCTKCGSIVCCDCEITCSGCNDASCAECSVTCGDCQESYCQSCLGRCQQCRAGVCSGCLDNLQKCSHCHDEEHDDECGGVLSDYADAAVQSHSLGETTVPA